MVKTTISLHPVPSGAVLLREGERADVLYRLEGGQVTLSRDGVTLLTVGSGALVGAAGALLGGPQLFTVVGSDRASFAKKYFAADLQELLSADEEVAGMLVGALEAELAAVESRGVGTDMAAARKVDAVAAEAGLLLADVAGSASTRVAGEGLARSPRDGAFAVRAVLRTAKICQGLYAIADGPERTRRSLAHLTERAGELAAACTRSA